MRRITADSSQAGIMIAIACSGGSIRCSRVSGRCRRITNTRRQAARSVWKTSMKKSSRPLTRKTTLTSASSAFAPTRKTATTSDPVMTGSVTPTVRCLVQVGRRRSRGAGAPSSLGKDRGAGSIEHWNPAVSLLKQERRREDNTSELKCNLKLEADAHAGGESPVGRGRRQPHDHVQVEDEVVVQRIGEPRV